MYHLRAPDEGDFVAIYQAIEYGDDGPIIGFDWGWVEDRDLASPFDTYEQAHTARRLLDVDVRICYVETIVMVVQ